MGKSAAEYTIAKIGYHNDRVMELAEGKDVFPVSAEINITNVCDLKCEWCSEERFREMHPKSFMPGSRIVRLLLELGECGVRSATLEGGEPTIHRDFEEIALGANYSLDLGLITNGQSLDRLSKEAISRFRYIRVSLDSADADTYRDIKGGDFRHVVSNIEKVAAIIGRDQTLGLSYILTPETIPEMFAAIGLASSLGVDYIQFKPKLGQNGAYEYFDMGDKLEAVRLMATDKLNVILTRLSPEEIGKACGIRKCNKCKAHRLVTAIEATGEVMLCGNIKHHYGSAFSFGSLYRSSFSEIWRSERRHAIVAEAEREGFTEKHCGYCRLDAINDLLDGVAKGEAYTMWRFI